MLGRGIPMHSINNRGGAPKLMEGREEAGDCDVLGMAWLLP